MTLADAIRLKPLVDRWTPPRGVRADVRLCRFHDAPEKAELVVFLERGDRLAAVQFAGYDPQAHVVLDQACQAFRAELRAESLLN